MGLGAKLKKKIEKFFAIYPADREQKYKVIKVFNKRFMVRVSSKSKVNNAEEYAYMNNLPVEENKIAISAEYRDCGGAKLIAEEIIRRGLPYDVVWIANANILDHLDSFPSGIRMVMSGTLDALVEMATSKLWIDNKWRSRKIKKKENQVYVQLWHGASGIKKYGQERHDASRGELEAMKRDLAQVDYFISDSVWETEFYKRALDVYRIEELGQPKNDILYSSEQEKITAYVKRKLHIGADRKIVYYVPALAVSRDEIAYTLDFAMLRSALSVRFGGDWIVLTRIHLSGRRNGLFPENADVMDVSDYANPHELMVAAEVCVSDYASYIFDYLHTRKPAFLFASDYESYARKRGLYLPLSETPFSVAENNEMLAHCIETFDIDEYRAKVDAFLKKRGSKSDGHAAQRVVNFIQQIMAGNELV